VTPSLIIEKQEKDKGSEKNPYRILPEGNTTQVKRVQTFREQAKKRQEGGEGAKHDPQKGHKRRYLGGA